MAERRMYAKTIVLSDAFLDMPLSARCLYFTLGMVADDDGFVNSPKSVMRQCGASQDDMNILISKKFILLFESGIIVIKHWRIHNYIQSDRYIPTKYNDEKSRLALDDSKAYTMYTECIQNVYKVDTQDRLGKDSLGKDSLGKDSLDNKNIVASAPKRFEKPNVEQVREYCEERCNNVDAESFVDFYESKGWKVGNQPMKNWKAAVRTWERNDKNKPTKVVKKDRMDALQEWREKFNDR